MHQFSSTSRYPLVRWAVMAILIVILCQKSSYGIFADGDPNGVPSATAALISVTAPFTADNLQAVRRQVDRATDSGVGTIVFRLSGRGQFFDSFADLARYIRLLTTRDGLDTIAYIPKEALGTTMLAVFACQTIITDEFAQLGQVTPPRLTTHSTDGDADGDADSAPPPIDRQALLNKITSLARAAGHNQLLAQAMTDKRTILYLLARAKRQRPTMVDLPYQMLSDDTFLVDQVGFERLMQTDPSSYKMVGPGPVVTADSVLLLDGRRAQELGLVAHLAADREELASTLKLVFVEIAPAKLQVDDKPDATITGPTPLKDFDPNLPVQAAVITISDMIDQGLVESLKRRTQTALDDGAHYIIYRIDTFGGRVDSAIAISDYFTHEVAPNAHTVAYIPTNAFSAGALISVACNDIIMKRATKIGDCAPILLQGKLEGTEREKAESPLRAIFTASAEQNGYPVALCKAMVTASLEVFQVKNLRTDTYEYFESEQLPKDPYTYDLAGKKLIVKAGELLTVTAEQAHEYGLNRAVVDDLDGALEYIEKRNDISFARPVSTLDTNWSEELVRWLTSPTVAGILLMVAMLGIYAELNSPGVGLPGAVALIALALLFGSKYFIGMANWWELAIFGIGILLLVLEVFVIPGFGIAGVTGLVLIVLALIAMLVGNPPDQLPLPRYQFDRELFVSNLKGLLLGLFGFCVGVYFLSKYLPKIPVANRFILAGPALPADTRAAVPAVAPDVPVTVGQTGITLNELRPAGTARFDHHRVDVVSQGELIKRDCPIVVVAVEGNRIVVREQSPSDQNT